MVRRQHSRLKYEVAIHECERLEDKHILLGLGSEIEDSAMQSLLSDSHIGLVYDTVTGEQV